MGFGMTTVLLNLHNAGFFPLKTAIISMGIFLRWPLAQILAGLASTKGNTFGMTGIHRLRQPLAEPGRPAAAAYRFWAG